ncbi:hypothetical protein GM658_10550 [Pseudoduganella eburnea]|uniref:T6SS Phospholipase effector Tle1-like catalytic domain-containing protein n=1 Tax=Massilia eburnea TaxID=1776165 RepID=A0A6L6QFW9_9BURK|nr:DUF2235 domain-containing protein [Massilia eburnea]MTW11041.1 hypothetical protein [Massilia eburnea]
MTKSPNKESSVGDSKAPALAPHEDTLRYAADSAKDVPATRADPALAASVNGTLASALNGHTGNVSPGSCLQTLWFSFFFDGTGNNLDADVGTKKHSNVAKLFRAHRDIDTKIGIYPIYVPGVGTYFKDVGDDGGTTLGLGTGDKGDVRVEWALKEFDRLLAPHAARAKNPSNAITEINFSVFGFSRGAALARAFTNELLKQRCKEHGQVWKTQSGGYRVRVRFLGLFDTVASVGLPMSTNNVDSRSIPFGYKTKVWWRLDEKDIRPEELAFEKNASPGADPSPGRFDGHVAYGGKMAIPEMAEEVRHYIAAHEIRNSFPVESVCTFKDGRLLKPAHFYEYVYPGVHSDVGGSYLPGEGGRSNSSINKLGLIPLQHMYDAAVNAKVPLLPRSAWAARQKDDFEMGKAIVDSFNHYLSKVPKSNSLGQIINANMGLYYAWRFRDIRRKLDGNKEEATTIAKNEVGFKADGEKLDTEIDALEKKDHAARSKLDALLQRRQAIIQSNYGNPNVNEKLAETDEEIKAAGLLREKTRDAVLRAKAKKDALPSVGELSEAIQYYDERLLKDAKTIYDKYRPSFWSKHVDEKQRRKLRPHYQAMMTAYENEFIHNNGLKDEKIIDFFDNYVHDSLSGFAKDATMPSDPRVVYVGGDEKFKYALNEHDKQRQELEAA